MVTGGDERTTEVVAVTLEMVEVDEVAVEIAVVYIVNLAICPVTGLGGSLVVTGAPSAAVTNPGGASTDVLGRCCKMARTSGDEDGSSEDEDGRLGVGAGTVRAVL